MRKVSVELLEFKEQGDDRGHLVVVEGNKEVVRGQHANKRSEFVLINVAGNSKVKIDDGKGNEAVFSLNRPHTGIYLPKLIWKDMYDFSADSVLLCLSSEHYDAEEYIRSYDEFIEYIKNEDKVI